MFVSGLSNDYPVLKGSSLSSLCIPSPTHNAHKYDRGNGSSYAICASCAAECCIGIDTFRQKNIGLQILEVDEFPTDLVNSDVAEYECVQFGNTRLVFKFKMG
jgi:hypothetical protein